jgi:cytochrome c oxidase subunit 4
MAAVLPRITIGSRAVVVVAVLLLALWVASWAISYAQLGAWSLVVALLIAAAKAVLVGLFFMELLAEPFTVYVTVIIAALLIATMMGLMIADVATRYAAPLTAPGRRTPYTTDVEPP